MGEVDLLKMLGLDDKPAEPRGRGEPAPLTGSKPSPQGEASPTALLLDKWDMDKGERCLKDGPYYNTLSVEEMSDFLGAAFLETPALVEHCRDPRRREYLQSLMETSDYKILHQGSTRNLPVAEVAANKLAEKWVALKAQDKECKGKKPPSTPAAQARAQRSQEARALKAAVAAAREALEEADDLEDTQRALGVPPGVGQGSGTTYPVEKAAEIFRRVRNNRLLRKILDRAGRYRRVAQAKQRQKIIHGYDDMVGITVSDDPSRILPSELALLDDEDLGLYTLLRLVEKQTLAKEYRGVEKVGKGPIVGYFDESGSMGINDYAPIAEAKAFALALYWIARHQKRWCCLAGFSHGRRGTRIILPPNKLKEGELMDWLQHFFDGGTSMDVALDVGPNQWWPEFVAQGMPRGKTDIFVVTDAQVGVPERMGYAFNEWKKKEQARLITLLVGGYGDAGDLGTVSDEVYNIDQIDVNDPAVERCLSI